MSTVIRVYGILLFLTGPVPGGPKGPYIQSDRLPIYQEQIKTLLDVSELSRTLSLYASKVKMHIQGGPSKMKWYTFHSM